jgi:selT/selW/selH-like putative selenoprotein
MARYYHDVKNFVESDTRYAALVGNVYGSNYPPSFQSVMVARVTSSLWMGGIFLMFAGDTAFNVLKMPHPYWYTYVKENKVTTFAGLFLLNNFGNSQLATGAFEIYIDDKLVYSKLETKRLPKVEDIQNALTLAGY